MKIAVTSMGGSMSAKVSEQFGRCAYFLIVDPATMKFEPVSNPGGGMMGGAGPEAARIIANHGVKTVLTGRVGPKAAVALNAAGIRSVTGFSCSKTVREAVEEYKGTKRS